MNEEKEKIIIFASEKFLRGGFYRTTMDEIAAEMHISKKTIYRNFSSKEELVIEVAKRVLHQNAFMIEKEVKSECNPVEKLCRIIEIVGKILMKMSDTVVGDIHHYSPKVWNQIDEFRTKKMTEYLTYIISAGQQQSLFVKKNPEIMISIFIASVRSIVNPQFIINNRFTMAEALRETVEILMNGILTEKGKKVFNKLKDGANK